MLKGPRLQEKGLYQIENASFGGKGYYSFHYFYLPQCMDVVLRSIDSHRIIRIRAGTAFKHKPCCSIVVMEVGDGAIGLPPFLLRSNVAKLPWSNYLGVLDHEVLVEIVRGARVVVSSRTERSRVGVVGNDEHLGVVFVEEVRLEVNHRRGIVRVECLREIAEKQATIGALLPFSVVTKADDTVDIVDTVAVDAVMLHKS